MLGPFGKTSGYTFPNPKDPYVIYSHIKGQKGLLGFQLVRPNGKRLNNHQYVRVVCGGLTGEILQQIAESVWNIYIYIYIISPIMIMIMQIFLFYICLNQKPISLAVFHSFFLYSHSIHVYPCLHMLCCAMVCISWPYTTIIVTNCFLPT